MSTSPNAKKCILVSMLYCFVGLFIFMNLEAIKLNHSLFSRRLCELKVKLWHQLKGK